ncbi:MAG TPA: efflux RND transporter periplasmic adaptor subunit [Candidatus Paceibacterota bacterium]|nr:efflux RND transporter periplasmic adaptor subunit [Verrucomicrobiota bacterium]HRY50264.1 efflux RND transporter periplasmic adaptor subunit [Candidatus Paceibacterota bacterium]
MQLKNPIYDLLIQPKAVLTALFCGLCLTACQRQGQAPPPMMMTPEVSTVTVAPRPILLTTELPGRTSPFLIAEIRPQVNGLIQKRLFKEGSDVQAGQELYQIDPAPFQAALDNAKAALGRAEASLPAIRSRADRFRQALADKAVSQQDFDDADAALNQAEADTQYWKAMVETARINLGYARVLSPISGRIGKSSVTDGAIVTAYQPVPLATIQQLDPIYVDVPQSTAELLRLQRRLKEGQLRLDETNANTVQLILGDGTKYEYEGTMQFRDVSVDPTTASVILRMVFPNPKGILLPGMFVRAVVKEGINTQAILIPQQSVSRDPKGNPVAMIVNATNAVEQRLLTVERTVGDKWLVSSGLTPGDRVVVESMQVTRPGTEVKAVPFVENQPPGSQPAGPASTPEKSNE